MATSKKGMSDEEWELLADIGKIMKQFRLDAGLMQRDAAKLANTSQARVPVLEKGQADVMITTLNRWANVYGYALSVSFVPLQYEEELPQGDAFDAALAEAMADTTTEGP